VHAYVYDFNSDTFSTERSPNCDIIIVLMKGCPENDLNIATSI
jgi:hypothetical protein